MKSGRGLRLVTCLENMSQTAPEGSAARRVVYILTTFPNLSETFIADEIEELLRLGWEVSVFSLLAPTDEKLQGLHPPVEVTYVPRSTADLATLLSAQLKAFVTRPVTYVKCALWAMHRLNPVWMKALLQAGWIANRLMEAGNASQPYLHVHAHFANKPALTAMFAAKLSRLPFSFTSHAKDIYSRAEAVRPTALVRQLAEAKFAVAVTENGKRRMVELITQAGVHAPAVKSRLADKIQVIHCGIDVELWRSDRQYLATGQASSMVLAVGRLVPKKGFERLIKACALLRDEGLSIECRIVGDGELRPKLDAMIRSLDMGDNIFLLGAQPRSEIYRLLQSATIFALPCMVDQHGDQDGMPVSILEAMAMGLPVVTSPVGGVGEAITSEDFGVLVPPTGERELANILRQLWSDPCQRSSIGKNARRRIIDQYNLRTNVSRLSDLFTS